jgi:type II secretory pathway predicted ATPase ExeA
MFEQYFGFEKTPFARNIPESALFSTNQLDELCSRLDYTARNSLFAVITGDVGTGKTTAIRKFSATLQPDKYTVLYISDSALTPRNFYYEVLNQFGIKPHFYRGDAKRQLMRELLNVRELNKKQPVIIVDEAHLLTREMLEEIRFLLNYKMDSENLMSLILVGQLELRDVLKKQVYEAIRQRIDLRYSLALFDRADTAGYVKCHLEYAGETRDIFSDAALDAIFAYSKGSARRINKLCTTCLIHAAQTGKRIIDDHMISLIIDEEFSW